MLDLQGITALQIQSSIWVKDQGKPAQQLPIQAEILSSQTLKDPEQ